MRFGKIRIEDGNLIFARHMMLNNLPCKDIIWAYMRREGVEGGKQKQFTTSSLVVITRRRKRYLESPEEALADRISLEEVLRALPEQDRQLIQLRFYGNRTQSETAKVLHTTQVQISRRERKILVLLRRRLLEE